MFSDMKDLELAVSLRSVHTCIWNREIIASICQDMLAVTILLQSRLMLMEQMIRQYITFRFLVNGLILRDLNHDSRLAEQWFKCRL